MNPVATNILLFLLGLLVGMVFWGIAKLYSQGKARVEHESKSRVYLLRISEFAERFEKNFERLSKALVPSASEEYEVSVVLTGHCPAVMPNETQDLAGYLSHAADCQKFREFGHVAAHGEYGAPEVRLFKLNVHRPTDLLYVEVHGPGVIVDMKINGFGVTTGDSTNCKRLSLLGWKMNADGACVVAVQFRAPKRRLED